MWIGLHIGAGAVTLAGKQMATPPLCGQTIVLLLCEPIASDAKT